MNLVVWSVDGEDWRVTTHPEDLDLTDCDVMTGLELDDNEVLLDFLQSTEVSWVNVIRDALEVDGVINSHAVAERLIQAAVAVLDGEGFPRYLKLRMLEQMMNRAVNEVGEQS
jgi:hypothetical protein